MEAIDKQEPVGCRYITGDLRDDDWCYCQDKRRFGSAYCQKHYDITHKRPDSPDDAE